MECFYDLENMELFYDLEKSWNTFMIYKIYSILINSIFYYNPMREIEEEKGENTWRMEPRKRKRVFQACIKR